MCICCRRLDPSQVPPAIGDYGTVTVVAVAEAEVLLITETF